MEVTIYHNPRCSKSRQTLQLLRDHDCEPIIVEYLTEPPTRTELQEILGLLNLNARAIMRKQEPIYQELALDNPALKESDLIAAMADNPILIERPIVVTAETAVIGRPPENVDALFDE